MSADLILRNALLADGRTVDVHVSGGIIVAVEPAGLAYPPDVSVDDLGGMLLVPAMAEPHAHLDKALTADVGDAGKQAVCGLVSKVLLDQDFNTGRAMVGCSRGRPASGGEPSERKVRWPAD